MLRLLSVSLLLVLTACNGGEDFSDAELGGPVLQPVPKGDPLNPAVDANEVVFISGGQTLSDPATTGIVNNLGYRCGDVAAYIPGPDDSNNPQGSVGGVPTADLPHNLARCPLDAAYVDFFLGEANGGSEASRLVLGRYWFPQQSNQGRYLVSPADLIQSPARVAVAPDSKPVYMAALLQALDGDPETDPTTPKVIDIPPEVHGLVAEPGFCDESAPESVPAPPFDQVDYNAFFTDWTPWLDALEACTTKTHDLPGDQSKAISRLEASLDRANAGTYSTQGLGQLQETILAQLGRAGSQPLTFLLPLLTYPDGAVTGMGLVLGRDDDSTGEFLRLVGVQNSAEMDRQGFLQGVTAVELPGQPSVSESASLELRARVLGNVAYYDEAGDQVQSDYLSDYPESDYEPRPDEDHILNPEDRARYDASGGGWTVNDGLYWLVRTGQVAINLDQEVINALPQVNGGRFYDVTLYRACVELDSSSSCRLIPNADIEIGGSHANYPDRIDAGADDDGFDVTANTGEIPKEGVTVSTTTTVRLQVLDNGDVVTDLGKNCAPVDPTTLKDDPGEQEYRVGFVSRTNRDDQGDAESINLTLLFAGDPTTDHDEIPQYGTQVQGRIDVRAAPGTVGSDYGFFRLGDENFLAGLRAFWTDSYKPRKMIQDEPPGDNNERKHLISSYASGAAEGAAVTNADNCPP